jgi:hypothetical protein
MSNVGSNVEAILRKWLGEDVEIAKPSSRVEVLLLELMEQGLDLEDAVKALSKITGWLGETTTPLYVGSTTNPIIVEGVSVTAKDGDVAQYGGNEFIFSKAGVWQNFIDIIDVYTKDESDARYLQKSGGAVTGQITTSVTTFTNTSLVTKSYVDNAIANITDYDEEAF